VGLLDLLSAVLDSVRDVPVLAAGGIGNGRAMAAALAAGADGVRVGTRFVATEEAGVHPVYTDALIAARAEDSVYTQTFHVGWPEAPHRALRSAIDAAAAFQGDVVARVTGLDGVESPCRASAPGSPIAAQSARSTRCRCTPASRSAA
jgi:NAD(P)H-dependent flavin oxidoreductase YrpB (nitropropane dioxygenase family)